MKNVTRVVNLGSDSGQQWHFAPEGGDFAPIAVPAGGWRTQGHTCDAGTYRTVLRIPAAAKDAAVILRFAAINFGAEIYLARPGEPLQLVAQHINGWVPVRVDLTGLVEAGKSYTLEVRVQGKAKFKRQRWMERVQNGAVTRELKDCYIIPEGAPWQKNIADGIIRGVTLEILPAVCLEDVYVRTSVAEDRLRAQVRVRNTTARRVPAVISAKLAGGFRYPQIPDTPVTLEPGETRTFDLSPIAWGLGAESFWWPNVPYQPGYRAVLHHLNVALTLDGQVAHKTAQRFGFREFSTKGPHYYLNGIRCNLRGDNQQEANFGTDAYGIFPGFGPPSKGNPGWPAAVDNLLRLNFNVLRIHQVPGTPYMLDVCDELGLMVVDETPVRGSETLEDFVGGWEHMLNVTRELAARDRQHPSIVLWSAANEIWGQRDLALALHGAIWAVDRTRPIIIDGVEDLGPDIINMEHYTTGMGCLPDKGGTPRTDRPYGETEAVWPMDNSWQGFAWMATATRIRRLKGNADIRNYVLNNAWSNYVPGQKPALQALEKKIKNIRWEQVTSGDKILPPLEDPWNHRLIGLLQKCFSPVTACDVAFDEANKKSDEKGRWPTVEPDLPRGTTIRRELAVFNDTFAGTDLQLRWQVRRGSAAGPVHASGRLTLSVPLGEFRRCHVVFATPARPGRLVLCLAVAKESQPLFEEDAIVFRVK